MQKDNLVTGMTFASSQKHSNLFPSSPLHSTKLLKLIHSDLCSPLLVATRKGYCYWITFLDDATSYRAATSNGKAKPSKHLFKLFKATVENQLNAKIKELQDDKEGK